MIKILTIQTAFIGDALLTLPAIEKLNSLYPDSKIDVLCIPESKNVFELSPFINQIIVLDKKGKHKSLLSTYKFTKQLRSEGYDYIFSFHRSFRTALIVLLTEVKETFGFSNSSFSYVYKNIIPYRTDRHEVQRNLDLIGWQYDAESWKIIPSTISSNESKKVIQKFLDEVNFDDRIIAIAPGSVWKTKQYPLEHYENIIGRILENDYNIVLIGGQKDEEICDNLASKVEGKVKSFAGKLLIGETVELLKDVKLLLSNDSAPTHMGMCADAKVLTLYCSTIADFGFYPYNYKSKYLSYDDLDCKPCGIHGHNSCPIGTFECGLNLKPDEVIKTIMEMLND